MMGAPMLNGGIQSKFHWPSNATNWMHPGDPKGHNLAIIGYQHGGWALSGFNGMLQLIERSTIMTAFNRGIGLAMAVLVFAW